MVRTKNAGFETGFTLVEVLLSIVISALLVGGIAGMTKLYQEHFQNNQAVWETEQSVYFGMDLLIRELREAKDIEESNSDETNVTFVNVDSETIAYRLNSDAGTLERDEGNSGTYVTVVGNLDISNSASKFTYNSSYSEVTIRLKGKYQEREVVIENTVTPRNL